MVATEVAKPFDSTPIATALEFRKRNRRATGDIVDAAVGSNALKVSVAGGGASINIEDGRAIVQGALYEISGGPLNKTVSTPGSTRTDFAVLTYDDSHTPGVYARVLEGAALIQNDTGTWDMPLATWQKTPAGAITNLVDLRQFRGSLIVPCTSTRRPQDPTFGMIAYEIDTGRHIKWTGTAWVVILEDSGLINLTLAAGWAADGSNTGRLLNGQVELTMNVKRTGAAIPEGGSTLLTTLAANLRPVGQHKYDFVHITNDNNARLDVETTGLVSIRHQWAAIGTGEYIRFTFNYQRGGE